MISEIIKLVKKHKTDIILTICIVLISLFSFAMGYIVAKYQGRESIQFQKTVNSKQ